MIRYLAAAALVLATPAVAQQGEPVSAIQFNQLGFETQGPKLAIVADPAAEPLVWELLDSKDAPVLAGKTEVFGDDAASGKHLHRIYFSAFVTPGDGYRLRVGEAVSRTFAITARPRGKLASDALAFFYHQRAGVPIEARLVGEEWARPAGHAKEVVACFKGADVRGTAWPGCGYTLDVTGGWYDAGDQGKYLVNGGIALWTLQNAYERAAKRGTAGRFGDGASSIPEAGNGVSDLLDESRFEMEFFLAMQVPDGTTLSLPVGAPPPWVPPAPGTPPGPPPPLALPFVEVDAGGLAHHKVGDRNWTKLPTPPHEDREERLLYPPTTSATLNLAATAAQCARIWRRIDDAFAARCLKAAERAWAGAKRNPELYAVGAFTGSGGYGDRDLSDEFYWAAAELWVTTGEAQYRDAALASPHWSAAAGEPGWPHTATLGTLSIALAGEGEPAGHARNMLIDAADRFVADRKGSGYRIPYNPAGFTWGSTSNLLNRAMVIAYAADVTGEGGYRAAVVDSVDYLLGRNPLDQSFVSGYGARPMRNPHHRFWAPSLDANLPGPPPGVLSGGPNSTAMSDPVAQTLRGKCAPMTCWADEIEAYALNEVAINWNAPLFWVAAWLDE